jgi:hypothetical protein
MISNFEYVSHRVMIGAYLGYQVSAEDNLVVPSNQFRIQALEGKDFECNEITRGKVWLSAENDEDVLCILVFTVIRYTISNTTST